MKKLQCELCGGIDVVKVGENLFQCQSCGCKYTMEQARVLVQGTVELTKGAAERQRLLKNIEALTATGDYPYTLCSQLTQEFPGEAEAWFAWVRVVMAKIQNERLVRCCDGYRDYRGLISHYELDVLYANACKFASPAQREEYTRLWETFWKDVSRRAERGEYLIDLEDGWQYSTWAILLRCGGAAASIIQKGKQNADLLAQNGLRWGLVDLSSKGGWLPFRKAEGMSPGYGISFALGRQIKWKDSVPYSDRDQGVKVLDEPLALDGNSIKSYKQQAEKAARQLVERGVCPACGSPLKSSFFSKSCKRCHYI